MVNDVQMVSVFLPYVDVIFRDRETQNLLDEGGVRERLGFDTPLYSVKNLPDFFAYLDAIESDASKEHLNTISQVYGDDWTNPYKTMFELTST